MNSAPARLEDDAHTRLSAYAKSAIAALAGVALGLAATWYATDAEFPFGAASSGPWTAWPKTGSSDADPYARAIISRKADVPLGNGEGLSFFAASDDAGRPLDGSCEYAIEMRTPAARLWTLSAFKPNGQAVKSGQGRHFLSSATVLRSADGSLQVVAAPTARAGNWIAGPKGAPFVLVLNVYDTMASPTQAAVESLALPSIRRGECM